MKSFLPFTYDTPDEGAAPLLSGETDETIPVAIFWKPSIFCTALIQDKGVTLNGVPDIPWGEIVIEEIRVESRRVYEILHRITPPDQRFFVRINPPPAPVPAISEKKKYRRLILTSGDPVELALAADIAAVFTDSIIANGPPPVELIARAETVIFCYVAADTVDPIRVAIVNRCKILSTDAGSAEEYLTRSAPPGSWHIAHSLEPREYIEFLKDLDGKDNRAFQTNYIDRTPFIRACENERNNHSNIKS